MEVPNGYLRETITVRFWLNETRRKKVKRLTIVIGGLRAGASTTLLKDDLAEGR
jgi:hypothetical protein